MQVQLILCVVAAMALFACAPTRPTSTPRMSTPQKGDASATRPAPENPVDVSPGSPPEAHPLAPEAVPNKPQTIPEEMPGAKPPR